MLNRTYSDLKNNVGKNVQDTSSVSLSLWGDYINEAYSEFFKRSTYKNIRDDYEVTVTANTQDYVLPDDFGKEVYVVDTTNGIFLERKDIQKFAIENPSLINQSGGAYYYDILIRSVQEQPASASTLTIVSSSASDTAEVVYIRGLSGNTEVTESVTLNGTNNVTTTNQFTNISKITKDVTVGIITITAGAVTVATIAPRVVDYSVKILRLLQSPSNGTTITLPYHRVILPMTNDNDCPEADCGQFLISRATAKAWRFKRQFNKAQYFDAEAEKYLDEVLWSSANQPNESGYLNVNPYSREIV